MNDPIESPDHYTAAGVEAIEIIERMVAGYRDPYEGYLVGSILKYLYRAPYKGRKLLDCRKAGWFLDRLIRELEEAEKDRPSQD